MFAITPTDKKWFDVLKKHELNSYINFWTPTPWNVRNPHMNDRWYFLLKSPIRKISGFGEFVEYKNMILDDAWKYYGVGNGFETLEEFLQEIETYLKRNSKKYDVEKFDSHNHIIGCVILKNCQFWDSEDYLDPSSFGFNIAKQVEKHKIVRESDPFNVTYTKNLFVPLNQSRDDNKSLVNQRKGQGTFKGDILKAYDNKCAISQESCPELLDAAHIQNYINEHSHHIQNGILLRVDIHRLFDNGFLYIDKDYIIHISPLLKKTKYYKDYNNKQLVLPKDINDHPSIAALQLKSKNFRR